MDMLSTLTAPDLTLLFLGIVLCLGTAVLLMLWQIQRQLHRKRRGPRL